MAPRAISRTMLRPTSSRSIRTIRTGLQKTVGDTGLVWGEQATWEKAGNLVDDTDIVYENNVIAGLVNPGKTNYIPQPDGYAVWNPNTGNGVYCNFTCAYPQPSRKYYALDNYLEHTWDGKWYAKVDYLFSKSYGTTEGPTDTPIGQITNQRIGGFSGSTTAQWDFPDLMAYANGEQANSHRHTLKAFGSYAITPEWMVSGTYIIQSGARTSALAVTATPLTRICMVAPTSTSAVVCRPAIRLFIRARVLAANRLPRATVAIRRGLTNSTWL